MIDLKGIEEKIDYLDKRIGNLEYLVDDLRNLVLYKTSDLAQDLERKTDILEDIMVSLKQDIKELKNI